MDVSHGDLIHPNLADLLVPPGDEVSVDFELCVRLTDSVPLRVQLMALLDRLSDLATMTGAELTVDVEPNGDASDSGLALTFAVIGDLWIVELSPFVWDSDLAMLEQVRQRIESSGWVFTTAFHDPTIDSPLHSPELREDPDFGAAHKSVRPRLVTDRNGPDPQRFVDEVIDVAVECLGAAHDRWFLSFGSADATFSELLIAEGNRLGHRSDQWPIRLAELLPPSWTTRAIWPSGSESAHLMCVLGAHHLHEPPCTGGSIA